MAAQKRIESWQNIIWREWHNCKDAIYARHLFELVGDTPLGWGSVTIIILVGTLYGIVGGCLIGLVIDDHFAFENQLVEGRSFFWLLWLTGVGGAMIAAWFSQYLSWGMWLDLLVPRILRDRTSKSGGFNLELLFGFGSGLLLPCIAGAFLGGLIGNLRFGRNSFLPSALAGGIGGMIGNLVIMGNQKISLLAGIGLGVWLDLTWGLGFIGLLIIWLGGIATMPALGLGEWLVGWLAIGVGFGPAMVIREASEQDSDWMGIYRFRTWTLWWRKLPSVDALEKGLRLAQKSVSEETRLVWAEPLDQLARQREQPGQLKSLVSALYSDNWVNRFSAWHGLIELGGSAAEALRVIAVDQVDPLSPVAIWLLTRIEQETTRKFAQRASDLRCSTCLTHFDRRSVALSWGISLTYYGCRMCGQSRSFFTCPQGVVAILDETRPKAYKDPKKRPLEINWLAYRSLFDFDRVEIIQADDETVERFAVQVGNDTDPFRRPRYRTMGCVVRPRCRLSENSLRILQHTFGQVTVEAGQQI